MKNISNTGFCAIGIYIAVALVLWVALGKNSEMSFCASGIVAFLIPIGVGFIVEVLSDKN